MSDRQDKQLNASVLSAQLLLDKLSSIDGITTKKMFGGHGVFQDGKMFGLVNTKGEIFLKANEETRDEYESKGSIKHSKMPYFTIPDEVINDLDKFLIWAKKAIVLSK
ncbi:MAG: DNA transformation protein [Crocinitomicaceae bacterium]|jgi:DNA transformation protein